MAVIYTGKIQGQTSAGVAVATKDVTLDSDNFLRFTDSTGKPRSESISGDLSRLLKEIFTGVNGITHNIAQSD